MEDSPIHQNSIALWEQLRGKVDYSVQLVLDRLDQYQTAEDISPFLAETVRRMIFDSVTDDPNFLNRLLSRGIFGPKFIACEIEGSGGYRLQKAAQFVAESCSELIDLGDILQEYTMWQHCD